MNVDLEYPENLHDKFSDYPPAPDRVRLGTVDKLASNLINKKKYVCRNLHKYVELGCKVTAVQGALAFDESPWMRPYVEKNVKLRMASKNAFERNFFKIAGNSVFGKCCEQVKNRVDIKLVNDRKKALKLVAKPTYKQHTIYSEDLVGVQIRLSEVKLDKPSYVGVAILDISKILLYEFFNDFVKPLWGNNVGALFTDTNSLCLLIHTEDVYRDIAPHVDKWFDTSKYKPGNPMDLPAGVNAGVVGMFKDEEPKDIITEFVGLRAKCYAYKTPGGSEEKKNKGIKKAVICKHITFDDYKACVLDGTVKHVTQNTIRSRAHNVLTESLHKKALCARDDKRVVLGDGIHTLPIGHWRVS